MPLKVAQFATLPALQSLRPKTYVTPTHDSAPSCRALPLRPRARRPGCAGRERRPELDPRARAPGHAERRLPGGARGPARARPRAARAGRPVALSRGERGAPRRRARGGALALGAAGARAPRQRVGPQESLPARVDPGRAGALGRGGGDLGERGRAAHLAGAQARAVQHLPGVRRSPVDRGRARRPAPRPAGVCARLPAVRQGAPAGRAGRRGRARALRHDALPPGALELERGDRRRQRIPRALRRLRCAHSGG